MTSSGGRGPASGPAGGTSTKEEEVEDLGKTTVDAQTMSALDRFDYLRFTVADLHGIPRSKSVSRRHFRSQMKDGITMYAGFLAIGPRAELSPLDEICAMNFGNCAVRPMPGTLRELPWAAGGKHRVGEVLCETFWMKPYRDGVHQDACPRYMARKQLERLGKMKFALFSSFEAEFMVFKRGTLTPIYEGMDVNSNLRMSELEEYVYGLDEKLGQIGVHTVTFQTEHGSGQFEFALEPTFGIEAVDRMFSFKEAVKELSLLRGWQATFMAQPFPEASNNGLHFNHSIWSLDGTKNQFADPSDPDGLSGLARHWVAGLTKHARALSALCCPTVNCYRRLFTPWAPEKNNWGIDDRFACFRVKAYGSKSAHVESRLPSGAANPYLVLAATVAAGLDGIVNRLECPPSREQDTTASADLPRSLGEALKALEEDDWMRESLGEEFLRWFVQMKNESEIKLIEAKDDVELDPKARFEMERELYFELI